jgi:exopolysaccharide biosynthesis WecB/TagA/CpsF family protein
MGPLDVAVLARDEAIRAIMQTMAAGERVQVAFANTNLVVQAHKNPVVANQLRSFLILNDGIGLEIASRLFYGKGFPHNLNGTDFTPHFLAQLSPKTRVFLYGSQPHVVHKAATALEKACGVRVVGTQDGFTPLAPEALCAKIDASGAEILLVATGNPRQEMWLAEHMHSLRNVKVGVGVGALLDFMTGEFRRAPMWVRRIHMEWAFRLLNEPRRLARRYTLDILHFLWVCWRCPKHSSTAQHV